MIPENPNDLSSTGSEIDLIALLGPKVWDGSGVEYCLLSSSTTCFQHDTTKVCIRIKARRPEPNWMKGEGNTYRSKERNRHINQPTLKNCMMLSIDTWVLSPIIR